MEGQTGSGMEVVRQGNTLPLLKYKRKIHEEKETEILGEIELIQKQGSLEAEI